jgi:hypothetical protein
MDPFTIISLVQTAASLSLKCCQLAGALRDLAQKYKQAELSILSLVNQCNTLETVVKQIATWDRTRNCEAEVDREVWAKLDSTLEVSYLAILALEKDLVPLGDGRKVLGFWHKSRIVRDWQIFSRHENLLRDQFSCLSLLLHIVQQSVPEASQCY